LTRRAIYLHFDNDQFDWNKLPGVSSMSTLPRSCSKHGSTLYFGGAKTAPHKLTGHVKWIKR
jgi:hypothetical protein